MADTVDSSKSALAAPKRPVILTEEQKQKPIWELAEEILGEVPPEEWDRIPYEAAERIDEYLYGIRKKETA